MSQQSPTAVEAPGGGAARVGRGRRGVWFRRLFFGALLVAGGIAAASPVTRSLLGRQMGGAASAGPASGAFEAGGGTGLGTESQAHSTAPPRVHALGWLEPRGTVVKLSPPSGMEPARVERLLVAEGQWVEAGAVVAVLDTRARREAAVAQAQALIDAEEARLAQVRAGAKAGEVEAQRAAVRRAEAMLDHAKRERDRSAELHKAAAVSTYEQDQRELEVRVAQAALEQARGTLEAVREVRPEDVAAQARQVALARAGLDRARADAEAAQVRALTPGRVLKIHCYPGELVRDVGIIEIGQTDVMYAVAEVFEADVARIPPGARAEVFVESTGARVPGVVDGIGQKVGRRSVLNNDPVTDTDARVVEVRIALGAKDSEAVAGLSNARVQATIFAGEAAGGRAAGRERP